MPRIANSQARRFVTDRVPFRGNNTYGRQLFDGSYAAFSYGEHWPLYLWWRDNNTWYSNAGNYSRTTSKHAGQLRPLDWRAVPLPCPVLLSLVDFCDGRQDGVWLRFEDAQPRARTAPEPKPVPAPEPLLAAWETPGKRRLLPLGE
jgi:hypothetical protein